LFQQAVEKLIQYAKCHAELVSVSNKTMYYETLNQIQGDKRVVFQPPAKGS